MRFAASKAEDLMGSHTSTVTSHDTPGNKIKSPHGRSFYVGIYMSPLLKIDIVFPWN